MKPIIGICLVESPAVAVGKLTIKTSYVQALTDAGATPLLIPVTEDASRAAEYIGLLDGLLLPGGQDISPLFYGQDPVPQVKYILEEQDRLEMELIRLAVEKGIPVMGICRGMQIMNVALGGTLVQDIPSQRKTNICHLQDMAIRTQATHTAQLAEGSLLESLLGKEPLYVNSYHHQAVDTVAPGLTVSAVAADGIVEAIENPEKNLWAVQWHPEDMYVRYPRFANLFRYLVEQAAKK